MSFKNLFSCAAIVAIAVGCNTGYEYGYGYNDWYEYDLDESDVVEREEFEEKWEGFGTFDTWDKDGDGYLSEKEWLEGSKDYYGEWDTEEMGYYSDWDTDGDNRLSTTEVALNTYDTWDLDGDGEIQKEEFETLHPGDEV